MKNLQELPKLCDSISYIYVEHAIIEQESLAIVAIDKRGRTPIPIASVTCLLLGPGTSITHAAIRAICDNGCMAIWCGERGTRFYAGGIGETRNAKNLLHQAEICMDEEQHMQAVRRMYAIRFPKIKTEGLTLQQIRGMEGIRVRKAYELASRTTGVKWKNRSYRTDSWENSDPVNQALSEGNALLYGVCHAGIVSLGYSPGLGFVHTGNQLSFVYDIADLYKADTTIPAAFQAVRDGGDLSRNVRLRCRERFSAIDVLGRLAKDIAYVLGAAGPDENVSRMQPLLWDGQNDIAEGGVNYGKDSHV